MESESTIETLQREGGSSPRACSALVERFQCPGCVSGCDTNCGSYKWDYRELRCTGHILGTMLGLGNNIALGLPKGFNKPGFSDKREGARNTMDIRLHPKGSSPSWDKLNIPVWAMVEDGFLFVRTYAPRINFGWVDVIEGGTMAMVPEAFDVATIKDEID